MKKVLQYYWLTNLYMFGQQHVADEGSRSWCFDGGDVHMGNFALLSAATSAICKKKIILLITWI